MLHCSAIAACLSVVIIGDRPSAFERLTPTHRIRDQLSHTQSVLSMCQTRNSFLPAWDHYGEFSTGRPYHTPNFDRRSTGLFPNIWCASLFTMLSDVLPPYGYRPHWRLASQEILYFCTFKGDFTDSIPNQKFVTIYIISRDFRYFSIYRSAQSPRPICTCTAGGRIQSKNSNYGIGSIIMVHNHGLSMNIKKLRRNQQSYSYLKNIFYNYYRSEDNL